MSPPCSLSAATAAQLHRRVERPGLVRLARLRVAGRRFAGLSGQAPGRLSRSGHLAAIAPSSRAEHWVIIRGVATITLGERVQQFKAGEHVRIPLGTVHRLAEGDTPVELIGAQLGSYLGEDDIIATRRSLSARLNGAA